MKKTFILGRRREAFIKLLNKVKKKAEKIGLAFEWRETGVVEKRKKMCGSRFDPFLPGEVPIYVEEVFREFEISEDLVKVPGEYTFLGYISHKDGFIVSSGNGEIPHEFAEKPSKCDHCLKKRNRNDTFILKNNLTEEFIQVGRNCLKDFIGWDGLKLAQFFQFSNAIETFEYSEEYGSEGIMRGEELHDLELVLKLSAYAIYKWGFVSRSKARETESYPTSDWVGGELGVKLINDSYFYDKEAGRLDEEELEEFDKIGGANVKDCIEWWLGKDKNKNNYFFNCVTIAEGGMVNMRTLGTAVSMMGIWKRNVEKEKNSTPSLSKHQGSVGERLRGLTVRLINRKVVMSEYSDAYYIYEFKDKEGNLFTWFTGKYLGVETEEGEIIIDGTVKRHDEYLNVPKTILSRVRIK